MFEANWSQLEPREVRTNEPGHVALRPFFGSSSSRRRPRKMLRGNATSSFAQNIKSHKVVLCKPLEQGGRGGFGDPRGRRSEAQAGSWETGKLELGR